MDTMEAVGFALFLIVVHFLLVIGFGLGIVVVMALINFLDDEFGIF